MASANALAVRRATATEKLKEIRARLEREFKFEFPARPKFRQPDADHQFVVALEEIAADFEHFITVAFPADEAEGAIEEIKTDAESSGDSGAALSGVSEAGADQSPVPSGAGVGGDGSGGVGADNGAAAADTATPVVAPAAAPEKKKRAPRTRKKKTDAAAE